MSVTPSKRLEGFTGTAGLRNTTGRHVRGLLAWLGPSTDPLKLVLAFTTYCCGTFPVSLTPVRTSRIVHLSRTNNLPLKQTNLSQKGASGRRGTRIASLVRSSLL